MKFRPHYSTSAERVRAVLKSAHGRGSDGACTIQSLHELQTLGRCRSMKRAQRLGLAGHGIYFRLSLVGLVVVAIWAVIAPLVVWQ